MKSKAETFIGFAVRSGKYKTGVNAIKTLKKAFVMVICKSAAINTVKDCIKLSSKFSCPIYVTTEKELSEIVFKEGVKTLAVTDKALARAIIDAAGKDIIELNLESING